MVLVSILGLLKELIAYPGQIIILGMIMILFVFLSR